MRLFVKVIPLRAGTSESAGDPRLLCCPPDVEPDTILSFLTQQLGEIIETAWTSTSEHTRPAIGWIFPGPPAAGPQDAVEIACVPFIESPGGSLQPMFEAQADQRWQFAQLADSRRQNVTLIQQPHRTYHPAAGPVGKDTSAPDPPPGGSVAALDQTLAAIAHQTGSTLRIYPRPGHAVRRTVLRDDCDDCGTYYLDAALQTDGTLRITGHDQGPGVSDFFGAAITSYEWTYLVAPGQIPALIRLLGGHDDGDDVLPLLAAYHHRAGARMGDIMNHPDVRAQFSNWHS
jgi:hypothetical protein